MKKQRENKEKMMILSTIGAFVLFVMIAYVSTFVPILKIIFPFGITLLVILFIYCCEMIADHFVKKNVRKTCVDEKDFALSDYDQMVQKFFPEIEGEKGLLVELYQRFQKVEEALSNGDLECLKKYCTDSLCDNLYHQYQNYYQKKEKHVIGEMTLYAFNIQNIILENHTISIQMSLHVAYLDYVSDLDGKYLRGNDDVPKHEQFLLDFVIDQDKKMICPNCGSLVSNKTCEYCQTVFKDVYYDFSLANIGLFKNQQN